MTLLISGHFVFTKRVGGAEFMFYNLLRGLWLNDVHFDLLCSSPENLDPDFVAELSLHEGSRIVRSGGAGPRFIAEQTTCLNGSRRSQAILFPNYFTPPVVPARLGRIVTIIHDFQYRYFPEFFSAGKRIWLRWAHELTFRRADAVVAISESVRQDAIRFHGARAAKKMIVIPNPVSWERFGTAEGPHPLGQRPYVLTVASHYPHKNLAVLVRAFSLVAKRVPDLSLVLVGTPSAELKGVMSTEDRIGELASSLRLGDRVRFTGNVNDEELGRLYRHAALFAFPSLFEGFGMPPVEALGFGVPTLTTKCASLPEVTLGKANYVERPQDVEEWASRIEAAVLHPERFRVPTETTRVLRERYSPKLIGNKYAGVLFGDNVGESCTESAVP